MNQSQTLSRSSGANKVLKDTYRLLGLNLLTASFLSYIAILLNVAPFNGLVVIGVYFLLLFLVSKNENNASGVFFTFLFTGWLGFTLGPIVNLYLQMSNGAAIVTNALMGTAIIFVSLSTWVTVQKKDYTSWGNFLSVSILSAFIVGMLNVFFFQSSMFSIIISCIFMVLSGAIIMWQTSAIINGGERNYIRATTTLFVSLYNIFTILLQFLGMGGDD